MNNFFVIKKNVPGSIDVKEAIKVVLIFFIANVQQLVTNFKNETFINEVVHESL